MAMFRMMFCKRIGNLPFGKMNGRRNDVAGFLLSQLNDVFTKIRFDWCKPLTFQVVQQLKQKLFYLFWPTDRKQV